MILILEIALGVALGLLLFKHWQSALGLLFVGGLAAAGLYVLWHYPMAKFWVIFIGGLGLLKVVVDRIDSWIHTKPSREKIGHIIGGTLGRAAFAAVAAGAFFLLVMSWSDDRKFRLVTGSVMGVLVVAYLTIVGAANTIWNPKPSHRRIARTIRRTLCVAAVTAFPFWVLVVLLTDEPNAWDGPMGVVVGVLVLAYVLSLGVTFDLTEKTS